MRLRRDAPIEVDYQSYVPRPDLQRTSAMFATLEFKNMFARVKDAFAAFIDTTTPSSESTEVEVASTTALVARVSRTRVVPAVAGGSLVVRLAWSGEGPPAGLAIVADEASSSVSWVDDVTDSARAIAAASLVVTHDAKRLHRWLLSNGIVDLPRIFDVAIAGYLLDPAEGERSVADLVSDHLGITIGGSNQAPAGQLSFESKIGRAHV